MAFSEREKPDYYASEEVDQAVFNFLRHGDKPPKTMGTLRGNEFTLTETKVIPRERKTSPILIFAVRALRLTRF